jgi:YD repeat-containing protein
MITRNVGSAYSLAYDAENRLTGVTGSKTAAFIYDGDGNRVKSTVSITKTIYIGSYFEWTGSTGTMKKYYYAGATRVAMRTGTGTVHDRVEMAVGRPPGIDQRDCERRWNSAQLVDLQALGRDQGRSVEHHLQIYRSEAGQLH